MGSKGCKSLWQVPYVAIPLVAHTRSSGSGYLYAGPTSTTRPPPAMRASIKITEKVSNFSRYMSYPEEGVVQTGRGKLAYELLLKVQTLLSAQSAGEACFFAVTRSLGLALCAATRTCPCSRGWASHQLPLARCNGACRHRACQEFLDCSRVYMRVCVHVCMFACSIELDRMQI